MHPSFTAWLRCRRAASAATGSPSFGCIQASQLGYVAGAQRSPWGSAVRTGCIQASQLGYVAGAQRSPWGSAVRTGCIQASQLGYVAGRLPRRRSRLSPVASKLHSLATLQVSDAVNVYRGAQAVASKLHSLATLQGLPRPPVPGLRGRLHPSFTAWLRCRRFGQEVADYVEAVASKLHSLATLQVRRTLTEEGAA